MILDKDIVIVGRSSNGVNYSDISGRALQIAAKSLLKFASRPLNFPGQSPIVDEKGVPFNSGAGKTITIRRYNKFKAGGQDDRGQRPSRKTSTRGRKGR